MSTSTDPNPSGRPRRRRRRLLDIIDDFFPASRYEVHPRGAQEINEKLRRERSQHHRYH